MALPQCAQRLRPCAGRVVAEIRAALLGVGHAFIDFRPAERRSFERLELASLGRERGERVPLDLSPLLDAGLIEVIEPNLTLQTRFMQFAAELDDGEAMTIAAATTLEGAGVVTDDEAAIQP